MGTVALVENTEVKYLPIDQIKANPYQPRKFFERASLEELAKSIKEYGIMQPISVRLVNGYNYELIAGERRLRASKIAGLVTIPAIIVNICDQDSAVLAIIENLQRQNLNYLEEAEGFQNLIQDYNFTQEVLAEKVGKSQSTIANKLRILRLSKKVQKELIENNLTERHARALLKLEDEDTQLHVVEKIVKEGLTVKKTEEYIENLINKNELEKNPKSPQVKRTFLKDVRILKNTIKQVADGMNNSGLKTDYYIEESEGGCEILISVAY